ncbi:521_t:CDS:2 [Paraglomus occultum]|uniref:521_t:CDS:1 n=1 Tax=Paraglomus occultum TaxID=144539 RepID=A0A9N9GHP6_9GLOM|nr:521_t:CDS:2 [Paraglomus occultum]
MRRRQNREANDDDETWSKDRRLSARSKLTQAGLAAEIRSVAKTKIGLNQSAVSKLLNGQEVPKDNDTVDAIKAWIACEGQKRAIFETGLQVPRVDSVHSTGDEIQSDVEVVIINTTPFIRLFVFLSLSLILKSIT